jgi:hypothetical protein
MTSKYFDYIKEWSTITDDQVREVKDHIQDYVGDEINVSLYKITFSTIWARCRHEHEFKIHFVPIIGYKEIDNFHILEDGSIYNYKQHMQKCFKMRELERVENEIKYLEELPDKKIKLQKLLDKVVSSRKKNK